MKKTLFPIVLVSALMTIISCNKSFDAQEEGLVASSETKTFTATIESDDTKTTLTSERKVNWVSGDKIAIIDNSGEGNGGVYTATPKTPATQATFTFVDDEGTAASKPNFVAYYPAKICWDEDAKTKTNPTLPAEQKCDGTFALSPMYASSKSTSLPFKNICSVIKLKTDIANVSSIELSTSDKNLSGEFTMGNDYAMTMTVVEATAEADKKVTLNVNEDHANDGYYYIAIPAQAYTTLTIKVTAASGTKTMIKNMPTTSLARNTIYTLTFRQNVALPAVFSVAEDKMVQFSPGNLQAVIDASGAPTSWRFATNQYDYIGNKIANTKIGSSEGTVDLFGWSTASTTYGINTSTKSSAYSGSFLDWGNENNTLLINALGSGWFTLSQDEWEYLLGISETSETSRDNAANLYKYGVKVCGKNKCLVIAPDGYTGTIQSSYDASTWATAEAEGLVCLPPAGIRFGSYVTDAGDYGDYWSSTASGSGDAYYLYFHGTGASVKSRNRHYGCPVRLVRLAPESE